MRSRFELLFPLAVLVTCGAEEARARDVGDLGPTTTAAARQPGDPVTWGLVLSGGAARGLAHIGVLRALEEERLRPDVVVGTSMGALVGALYASGYSSRQIAARLAAIRWEPILVPKTDATAWRGNARPRPIVRFLRPGGLRLPVGVVDDAHFNYLLADLLIESSAAAGGNFDRLPIRFRAVATDLLSGRPVVLSEGDVARAVRASIAIPLVLPPVRYGSRLLVDGGMASNLPVAVAREAGAERVIAVDVSPAPPSRLSEGGLATWVQLVKLVSNPRSPDSLRASDLLLRPELPGYGSADFGSAEALARMGYRGARAAIRAFADSAGIGRDSLVNQAFLATSWSLSGVEWRGPHNPVTAHDVTALADLPGQDLTLAGLRRALGRLYRAGLFESVWPSLEERGDSTILVLDVRERAGGELAVAAAYDNDEGERFSARASTLRLPPRGLGAAKLAATRGRFGWALLGSLESRPLDRGCAGFFLRGGHRESETRLFLRGAQVGLPLTVRREIHLGGQLGLPTGQVGQLGLGATRIDEGTRTWSGPVVTLRAEAPGSYHRLAEVDWVLGRESYARFLVHLEAGRPVGRFLLRAAVRAAAVGGDVPTDALVGLGGSTSLAGLRRDEWRGRRLLAGDVQAQRFLGSAFSAHASVQLGVVDDAMSAVEIPARPRPAIVVGGELLTPFGPVRLDWGIGPRGRSRLDVGVGDRF